MIQVRRYITGILTAIILCLLHTVAVAQGHNIFDRAIPSQQDVKASLELAKRLTGRSQLIPEEMLQIYYAEKKIGRVVWGLSPRVSSLHPGPEVRAFGYYVNSALTEQCVLYVQTN